jgi:hypothetical protein
MEKNEAARKAVEGVQGVDAGISRKGKRCYK